MTATLNYGAALIREVREREDRIARALYATWNESLNQPSWDHAQDGTRGKWRRLARVAIAETRR